MKRSMHDAIVGELGGPRAAYLDDTGHMSGVDSLLALDRAGARRRAHRRRPRAAARGRNRLHVGRGGGPMVIERPRRPGAPLGVARDRAGADRRVRPRDGRRAVDPHRSRAAAAGPFGTTIAHGFLTLSLVVPMFARGAAAARGLRDDAQLRPQPRPLHVAGAVGSRIRGRFRSRTSRRSRGKQARVAVTIELEGQEKPACVAEALFRFLNPELSRSPAAARGRAGRAARTPR